ncbi:MAG TPA: AraC family transcriptional regulator, partial [Roseivirga sp.]
SMKVLPFKIPKVESSSVHLQIDDEPYFYDKLHQHPELQLTWIVKGEGTVIYGDYLGEFRPDEMYLIGSNVPHVFRSKAEYYLPNSSGILSKSVFFKPELITRARVLYPETTVLNDLLDKADRGLRFQVPHNRKAIEILLEVFQAKPLARLGHLLVLLSELQSNEAEMLSVLPQKSIKESQGRRLDDVFNFTLDNYHRAIQLEEVAEVVYMNKAAFCRYFKQHTRKTYINFLNEIRLQKATELLKNSELNIAQIAFEVGFNNLSNFNRTFKMYRKQTPFEYRARIRVD